jgi:putative transposase
MPAVNGVGKPCAGEPHARFDGRELETEQRSDQGHGDEGHQGKPCGHQRLRDLPSMLVTAPALDPTKLLKGLRYVPRVIVTDKLASYRLAHRELVASVTHRRSKYLNRAENSHQPTRVRERVMKRFASPGQAQRFLFAFGNIRGHFRPRRHLISASQWRTEMRDRFAVWHEITAAAAA